ncbi:MAG: phosphoenolpyruvate synthase [Gammaproteobacteria bacterium]|nr:MAG: phosphoenolpyruvate synthase [Gammaproteobacteria bacterium]
MHLNRSRLGAYARLAYGMLLSGMFGLSLTELPAAETDSPGPAEYRRWIETMKTAPRGPFSQIRWFCNDGAILPPGPNVCDGRGGGTQHGEYTDRVKWLRADGYYVANILADIKADAFLADPAHLDRLAQTLIEQFLIAIDDGWILRRARFYRGALQEEGERRAARRLLYKMAERREWLEQRYLLLRTAARMLPHGAETDQVSEIRQKSTELAILDPRFQTIRNKIHISPDARDADRVREYAGTLDSPEHAGDYHALADLIQEVHRPTALAEHLDRAAQRLANTGDLGELLTSARDHFNATSDPRERYLRSAMLLRQLRERLLLPNGPEGRMLLLDTSLRLENEFYAAGSQLRDTLPAATRGEILSWLEAAVSAAYGTGLISPRQLEAQLEAVSASAGEMELDLARYRETLGYLGLLNDWGAASLNLYFGEAMQRYAAIEPLGNLFIQDQLRGSVLFFYAQALALLQKDVNRLSGVRQEILGEAVSGLHALNPGLASGVLHFALDQGQPQGFDASGIYVLSETTADLPPVAGIITAGAGNPLSHVQLLARNLGIPNVSVDQALLPQLASHDGEAITLAVTPQGSVVIAPAEANTEAAAPAITIEPDLDKLDLATRRLIPLAELSADDSGRVVGPKAAKLGELKRHYPEAVAEGLAIPFGVFRGLLDQPYGATGLSVFEWMISEYRRLEALPAAGAERRAETEKFRAELEAWVLNADPGETFRHDLEIAFEERFGTGEGIGVFVRSDTNIEDLPNFTGAGLNLTLPNVVGFDALLSAIQRVWASPFSARAFAWRQALMRAPEHVYPAILLLRTVPSEKSGVLVTQDVDTGDPAWMTVAINEGIGGAVDGQPAESLRINKETGRIRLLAEAATPWRRAANPAGGITRERVSGSHTILQPAEAAQLVDLVRSLPERFPPITDDLGQPAPADVEFGFVAGELRLFQIRPYLESRRARNSASLSAIDNGLADAAAIRVDLAQAPQP